MSDEATAMTAQNDTDAAGGEQTNSQATDTQQQQSQQTGATEQQASSEDSQSEGKENAEGNKEQQDGAPESYEQFTVPDGMVLNEAALEAFTPLAKEHNLNQADAQKFVDMYSQIKQQEAQAQSDQWAEAEGKWTTDRENDKEYGGEKYQENLGIAKRTLDKFGSPALTSFLEQSRAGNHPEVVRLFYRIGKELGEDGVTNTNNSGGDGEKSPAQVLYPNQGASNG